MVQQLPLAIKLHDDTTLQNYCWNGNEILRNELLTSLEFTGPEFYYIWGAHGTGKTHILQACCHYFGSKSLPSAYLPLVQMREFDPQILEGLHNLGLVCIDDIEQIATNAAWEEGLFHLYNKVRDNKNTLLLITGNSSPATLNINLADLRSRLSWGTVFHINSLDEEAKMTVLNHRALQRGLKLSAQVREFLIKRCSRDLNELLNILEKLDHASLAAQRQLTIPFVKQILNL